MGTNGDKDKARTRKRQRDRKFLVRLHEPTPNGKLRLTATNVEKLYHRVRTSADTNRDFLLTTRLANSFSASGSPNPESSEWHCRGRAFSALPAVISGPGPDVPGMQKCHRLQNNANRESTGFPTSKGQNSHLSPETGEGRCHR